MKSGGLHCRYSKYDLYLCVQCIIFKTPHTFNKHLIRCVLICRCYYSHYFNPTQNEFVEYIITMSN